MRTLSACILLFAFGISATTAVEELIVEVWFVAEPQLVRKYEGFGYTTAQAKKEIEGDLKYYVYEVNKFFESMNNYGLYMEIRSAGLEFADYELFTGSDITDGIYVSADVALERLQQWLANNEKLSKTGHDIAILFTGYDLYKDNRSSIEGYANLEAACQGDKIAIGVVEFTGTHDTAITLAHELGHSLGSPHDGKGNTCLAKDGYIMTAVSSTISPHRWSFSKCTEQSIENYMNKIKTSYWIPNCLTKANTKAPASTFNLKQEKNRDILKYKKICERGQNDKTGFLCLNEGMYGNVAVQDRMCEYLLCGDASTDSCRHTMPTEGMTCGIDKRCNKGKCVSAPIDFPTPANLNPNCLFNDTKSRHLYGNFAGTCAQLLATIGNGDCYNSVFEHRCCQSCAKVHTGTKNCEYGDKEMSCKNEAKSANTLLGIICYGTKKDTCCETCKPNTNIPGCPFGDQSTFCKNTSIPLGQRCYGYLNKALCCETCHQPTTNISGCPFGDSSFSCKQMRPLGQLCFGNNLNICCETCQPTTNIVGCLYGDKATWCDPTKKDFSCYSSNKYTCCETCHDYTG